MTKEKLGVSQFALIHISNSVQSYPNVNQRSAIFFSGEKEQMLAFFHDLWLSFPVLNSQIQTVEKRNII